MACAELYHAISNIIEKKKTLVNLRASEEKFHALIDAAKDGIAIIDERGKITQWNSACEKIFGYTKKEVLGKTLQFLMPPDRAHSFDQARKRISADLKDKSSGAMSMEPMNMSGIRKDGSLVQTEMSTSYFAQGSKWQGLAIIRDVTERKNAELEILYAKEKFRVYVENSPVAVFVANPEGKYEYVNEAASKLLGYSREELLTMSIPQLIFEEALQASLKMFDEVKETGRFLSEVVLKKKDGLPVYVILNSVKLPNGEVIGFCENITERKQLEDGLKESEEKFRSIVENSSDQIFMLDRDGRFLSINKTAAELFGMSPKEMIGKSMFERFPETIAAQFSRNIKNVFDTGKSMFIEEKMVVKGLELYNSTSLNPVRNDSGRVIAVTGIVRDITESKKAETALKNSEEQFRSLSENSPDMIFINQKGKLVYVNEETENVMGYTREEFYSPNFNFLQLIAPEFKEQVKLKFIKHLAGKELGQYECRLVTKDGQMRDAIINSRLINYNDEPAILGIVTDITERKNAENEILQQTERLKATFAASPDAIMSIDMKGNIVDCNEEMLRLFLYPSKESIIGKSFLKLAAETERKRASTYFQAVFENNKVIRNKEFTGIKSNGEEFIIEISVSLLKDYSGQLAGVIASARDITERKKAEERIRLLSSVVQQAIEGIAVSDNQGKILFVNAAWLKMHNFNEDEEKKLIGQWIMKFYYTQQLESINDTLQPNNVFRGRITQVRKDGTTFAALASLSPLRNQKGQIIGVIHMAKPLTEIVRDIRDVKSTNPYNLKKDEAAEVNK